MQCALRGATHAGDRIGHTSAAFMFVPVYHLRFSLQVHAQEGRIAFVESDLLL